MLESLLANELAGWRILIQIDPSPVAADIAEIAAGLLSGYDLQVAINPARLGVRENPFRLTKSCVSLSRTIQASNPPNSRLKRRTRWCTSKWLPTTQPSI